MTSFEIAQTGQEAGEGPDDRQTWEHSSRWGEEQKSPSYEHLWYDVIEMTFFGLAFSLKDS